MIPLYGRGCEQVDPRKSSAVVPKEFEIPRRPLGQRPIPIQVHFCNQALVDIALVGLWSGRRGCLCSPPWADMQMPAVQHGLVTDGTNGVVPGFGIIPTLLGYQQAHGTPPDR